VNLCKSCGAPIEWAVTEHGKRIPMDQGMHADGNMTVDSFGTARMTEERPARRTHFQSCPDAPEHRRKRGRR